MINEKLSGWLLVDKPVGITSFDVIRILRKQYPKYKFGHGGTLDPFASGLLAIGVNEGTKISEYILGGKKGYTFTMQFGIKTNTSDNTGETIAVNNIMPPKKDVVKILQSFIGEQSQLPHKFSAVKINGKKAYELSRENIEVKLKSRIINIYKLELLEYNDETRQITCKVEVSKGTYIRSLNDDIATKLNAISHLIMLRRYKLKNFEINKDTLIVNNKNILLNKVNMCNIELGYGLPYYMVKMSNMLDDILGYEASESEITKIHHGIIPEMEIPCVKEGQVVKILKNKEVVSLIKKTLDGFIILRNLMIS